MSADVIDAMRRVAATTAEMAATRLDLATLEVAQQGRRLSNQVAAAALALTGLGFGSTLAAMALAWWLGPHAGPSVLCSVAALWLGIGVAATLQWRRLARDAPPLLQDTLAQLREDAALLAVKP